MIPRHVGVALGAVTMLALSACGGSASSVSTGGSSPSAASGPGQAISLEAQDFQFVPATLSAPTDTAVTLTVKNTGTKKHNLTIKELGVTQDIVPGSTQTITLSTKSAATLAYYCQYHRDSKGMQGTLTVGTGGASGGTASPVPLSSPRAYPSY